MRSTVGIPVLKGGEDVNDGQLQRKKQLWSALHFVNDGRVKLAQQPTGSVRAASRTAGSSSVR